MARLRNHFAIILSLFLTLSSAKYDYIWLGQQNASICPSGSVLQADFGIEVYKLPPKTDKVRIAFVGDSLTQGLGSTKNKQLKLAEKEQGILVSGSKHGFTGFPFKISQKLAANNMTNRYELLNFGFDARFIEQRKYMQKFFDSEWATNSYFDSCDYHQALNSDPDTVVLMLGTNDMIHTNNSISLSQSITASYLELAWQLRNLSSSPELYLMVPPPILRDPTLPQFQNGSRESTHWMPQHVHELAKEIGLPQKNVLDLQNLFDYDKITDYYFDFCHLNDKGYQLIADKVYEVVFQNNLNKKVAQKQKKEENNKASEGKIMQRIKQSVKQIDLDKNQTKQ